MELCQYFKIFFFLIKGVDSDNSQDRGTPHQRKSHPPDIKGNSDNTDRVPIKIYAEGDHNVDKAFKQLNKAVKDEWIVSDLTESVLFRMPQQKVSAWNLICYTVKLLYILRTHKKINPAYEPRSEKTGLLHMRKQRRRSASR